MAISEVSTQLQFTSLDKWKSVKTVLPHRGNSLCLKTSKIFFLLITAIIPLPLIAALIDLGRFSWKIYANEPVNNIGPLPELPPIQRPVWPTPSEEESSELANASVQAREVTENEVSEEVAGITDASLQVEHIDEEPLPEAIPDEQPQLVLDDSEEEIVQEEIPALDIAHEYPSVEMVHEYPSFEEESVSESREEDSVPAVPTRTKISNYLYNHRWKFIIGATSLVATGLNYWWTHSSPDTEAQ